MHITVPVPLSRRNYLHTCRAQLIIRTEVRLIQTTRSKISALKPEILQVLRQFAAKCHNGALQHFLQAIYALTLLPPATVSHMRYKHIFYNYIHSTIRNQPGIHDLI